MGLGMKRLAAGDISSRCQCNLMRQATTLDLASITWLSSAEMLATQVSDTVLCVLTYATAYGGQQGLTCRQ